MSDKFEFIDVEYAVYQESDERYVPSIVKMCSWMEADCEPLMTGFTPGGSRPEVIVIRHQGCSQGGVRPAEPLQRQRDLGVIPIKVVTTVAAHDLEGVPIAAFLPPSKMRTGWRRMLAVMPRRHPNRGRRCS